MNYMKGSLLGSTAGLVFLSAALFVAIPPNLAQAQGDEGQGHGHGHAIAQNGDVHTEAKPQTWPTFKATTSKPIFSLYDALGRPENFTVKGMFRARGEGLANTFRPAPFSHDDYMASFFTDIFAEYNLGTVKIGAELFDSRGYFEPQNSAVSTTDVNAFQLGQAYLNVDLTGILQDGSRSSLTAGRFTKDVGSRRLIARPLYRNTMNGFTGLSYDWKGANKDQMTLLWTMPQIRLPDDTRGIRNNTIELDSESPDLQLFGGSYTFANVFGGSFEVYSYGLYERDTGTGPGSVQTRNRRLFIPGARLARKKKPGELDYDFEAIYQMGRARETTAVTDTRDLSVSAFFVHGEAGYTFAAPWRPRVALQYDHASGDSSNPNTFTRFDTLYGVAREYNPMALYRPVGRANLVSPAIRFEVTPSPVWDAFVAYRSLFLADRTDSFGGTRVRDPSGQSGNFAGHQVEARLRYWVVPDAMLLETGAAYLIKGRFLRDAPNAPNTADTFYGYLQTSFFF
ncbi:MULTISPECIES: alginate export family protein [unclassified Nitrobacter]|uniref:alginate export family protein n=1 Tax=unclassified Nitrobacter TaxID=2620411 RepID=UPI000592B040|nr:MULTISPECIES: alginate export family protein [unclassified Nitrobacter]MCB1392409.1 alginate export family protein [Nitrobacter sp.]MCV0387696.1 alginate export family protein [Nitrobacter sp.]